MIPVAHHDGNYFADDETLDRLEGEGRVAFRYLENCNGSARDIAGVLTYIRREWGHTAEPVSEETVANVRAASGDRQHSWTVEELKKELEVND